MADNTRLNTGADGDLIVSREISHGGDTSKLQGTFVMGISGTEGSYTAGAIGGDATNGLDVDVTRLPALVAGTANIGDVDVASIAAGDNNIGNVDVVTLPALPAGTNNIGDVDVLSVVPGTGATSLGKAVDSAGGATDTGVAVLAIRDDSLSTLTPADGDYTNLRVDSTGALHARITAGGVAGHADDAAVTPGTTEGLLAMFIADETATDSVDEGDGGMGRMTLDRKQIVTVQPHTAGGLSIFRSLDLDESEEEVKATAGQVYGAWVTNTHTATLYLKFYNATAANVTVGTTTPVITIPIPGNASDDISAVLNAGGHGIAFDTAITVAVTTGLADNDTGAPGASAFIANIFYK